MFQIQQTFKRHEKEFSILSENYFHQEFSKCSLMQTLSNSCERRFELLPASHKLPKDDASQHNDLPKRDFSRVFLFNGGGVVRR